MTRTHLALLRGVNVGGFHKIRMTDLREIVEGCGFVDAKTFIQSGNVVFTAPPGTGHEAIAAQLQAAIQARMGWSVPVAVFSRDELEDIIRQNPFPEALQTPKKLLVLFLNREPTRPAVEALDPNRGLPDRFILRGRAIYLYLPDGLAGSRLTNAYFDSKLKLVTTGRNWQTVMEVFRLF